MLKNILIGAVVFLGVIALYVVFSLLLAFPVMLLWNWLIPDLLHLPTIGFWQSWGLIVLCSLLFESASSGSSGKS